MNRPALRIVQPDPVDLCRRFEVDNRFDEIRRNVVKQWVVTFILVTGLAAVAVAIVAMSEVAK